MRKMMSLFAFGACLAGASVVNAHPASQIEASFDPAKRVLAASITHQVGDPVKHYIDKVDITLNGRAIIGQSISRQDNNVGQAVSYLIPDVKDGDVLAVDTNCNKGGKLKKEIVVRMTGL